MARVPDRIRTSHPDATLAHTVSGVAEPCLRSDLVRAVPGGYGGVDRLSPAVSGSQSR